MAEFEKIYSEFTHALLRPKAALPKGVIAPRAPNIIKRFGIYRNNVMVSLIEAMKSNFPIIYALVGDDFFTALAVAFINKHPPKLPMLFAYGDEFAAFIRLYSTADRLPYLADMAEVENLWRKAYHAKDATCIDISALQKIDGEQHLKLTFNIHPAVFILKSGWPIYSIWLGHETDDMGNVDLNIAQNIIINRPDVDVLVMQLDAANCAFFRQIINGKNLENCYNAAMEIDASFDLGCCLSQLFGIGMITGLNIN